MLPDCSRSNRSWTTQADFRGIKGAAFGIRDAQLLTVFATERRVRARWWKRIRNPRSGDPQDDVSTDANPDRNPTESEPTGNPAPPDAATLEWAAPE
jgi:hypothetical protein